MSGANGAAEALEVSRDRVVESEVEFSDGVGEATHGAVVKVGDAVDGLLERTAVVVGKNEWEVQRKCSLVSSARQVSRSLVVAILSIAAVSSVASAPWLRIFGGISALLASWARGTEGCRVSHAALPSHVSRPNRSKPKTDGDLTCSSLGHT
ncbi:hypothetical protein [Amycolatopsis sp. NPDC054798]